MSLSAAEESSYQSLVELLDKGDFDSCVRGCMEHIEEFGDSAKIWVLAGSALGSSDKPDQARSALLCALKIDPDHENAQVNYVTSCLHGGHKEDALKALKEFLPEMSDECLAFKLAPSLAEALEQGVLESTDLNPSLWIRIENILDTMEDELQGGLDLDDEDEEPLRDNVIQFPLKSPRPIEQIERPYALAHFIMEGGRFKSATLYVESNNFHLRSYDCYIASPIDIDDERGVSCIIEDPAHLAEYLFGDEAPKSLSFLKLCRQDWEYGEEVFFVYESISKLDKKMNGQQRVDSSYFEEKDYHFKKDALHQISPQDALTSFTQEENYKGFRRLNDLWSPPYLGEIVFKELKQQLKTRNSKQKAS